MSEMGTIRGLTNLSHWEGFLEEAEQGLKD